MRKKKGMRTKKERKGKRATKEPIPSLMPAHPTKDGQRDRKYDRNSMQTTSIHKIK